MGENNKVYNRIKTIKDVHRLDMLRGRPRGSANRKVTAIEINIKKQVNEIKKNNNNWLK